MFTNCSHTFLLTRVMFTNCSHTFLLTRVMFTNCSHTFLLTRVMFTNCSHTFLRYGKEWDDILSYALFGYMVTTHETGFDYPFK
jgi:hypothetical protein